MRAIKIVPIQYGCNGSQQLLNLFTKMFIKNFQIVSHTRACLFYLIIFEHVIFVTPLMMLHFKRFDFFFFKLGSLSFWEMNLRPFIQTQINTITILSS